MLNQFVLVGRLTNNIKEENGKAKIIIAVNRSFKNADGIYETDYIPIILFGGLINNMKDFCHSGDLVGVKGRIENGEEGLNLISEKITFLSSKKEGEENE